MYVEEIIMRTDNISNSILDNFNKLSYLAKTNIKKVDENYKPLWGLKYKHNNIEGFVSEIGIIERGKAQININNGKLEKIKKPFFSTWKRTLSKINNMLNSMTENFSNKTVKQTQVNVLVFPEEAAKRISEIQKKLARK